jgi:dipeptide/tripeptide permease
MKGLSTIFKFPKTFWIANAMELFERWAYYGMFTVLSVYLTDPISEGGLGFTNSQRGIMQAIVTAIIYLLPVLGGAIADRFGFRRVLIAAFATLASGYYFMGQFNGYAMVFAMFLIVAVGAAIFKPIIAATVSKTSPKGQDTIGFGIFYMIVNIGGFIGPFVASKLRDFNWNYVFIMCAVVILLNFALLIFYKEPKREEKKSDESLSETISQIFKNMGVALSDLKFLTFLLIMVGFWIMYMQIFFTLPVYITQWINTTDVYNASPIIANTIGTEINGVGIIRPEMMTNLAAFTIIFFQILISALVMKVKPITSMVLGTAVIVIGMSQFTFNVYGSYIVLGIIIIAFGEMASSPRIQEYIGRIAPPDKTALYMGVSYLPLAAGNLIGGLLSGNLYDSMSDKYVFLKEELVSRGYASMEALKDMDGALLFKDAMTYLKMDENQLNDFLYTTYQPGNIWYVFAGIGAATTILLFAYNKLILNRKDAL